MNWLKYNGIWVPICPLCGTELTRRSKVGRGLWLRCDKCGISFPFKYPSQLRGQPLAIPSRTKVVSRQVARKTGAKLVTKCGRCQIQLINYPRLRCPICGYRIPEPQPIQHEPLKAEAIR